MAKLTAYLGADMKNPFKFFATKHIVVSLRGNELWVITDKKHYTENELEKLYKMGFKDTKQWESVYFPTVKIGTTANMVKRVAKEFGIKVVVFTRMDRELYDRIRPLIRAEDGTPLPDEDEQYEL